MIDLTLAKLHLRVDGEDEDVLLSLYIKAATRAAEQYLNRNLYSQEDGVGSDLDGLVMNEDVQSAILLQVGHLYANRESVSLVQGSSFPELALGYKYLLNPYRLEMGV
jgi:hypothetical protein